jgi:hypothetical protein
MEASCSSETWIDFKQTTRRYNTKDRSLHYSCHSAVKDIAILLFVVTNFLERSEFTLIQALIILTASFASAK